MRALTLAFIIALSSAPAIAGDREDLRNLLNDFLEGAAGDAKVHSRFWADDLVYTSSSGKRFGKEVIMRGLQESQAQPVTSSYSAEDVDIRLYGDSAVVVFKLVGEDRAGEAPVVSHYFNTGTFVKRDGEWRAVAWQATKIPEDE
ncbi:nuclear transport factor 2 family protein [Microbulbifer taiwanensis]|uniref:Nuclear transport factor 2 family protein n=1 Tax=Microbulbifer taiwanensis TaxID=986746 RepID=A0ABW1YIQ6_9GAMM|nr:nuclear transport factor 2 family protein [Microbulbifer taiwanensis]